MLIVPPFSEQASMAGEEKEWNRRREIRAYPPLGLAYLAAALRSSGIQCSIVDGSALGISLQEIADIVGRNRPLIVGITVTSFTLRLSRRLAELLRERVPGVTIVVGGPHITHVPQSVGDLLADYGVRGDGEKVFPVLVEDIRRGREPTKNLAGLVYRDSTGRWVDNGVSLIKDMDNIAFPARDMLPEEKYLFLMSCGGIFTTIITNKGCLFDCIYCGNPHQKCLYNRSIDNVMKELRLLVNRGYSYINFIDECFTIQRKRTIALCQRIIDEGLVMRWGCATRADLVDLELLKLMKKAGCYDIRYGIESGNEVIRKDVIGKHISNEKIIHAIRDSKKAGLIVGGFFLFGHPNETLETMRQTIRFAKKLNPHYAAFMIATPIPGSRLFRVAVDKGKLSPNIWKEIINGRKKVPIYVPDSVTLDQMQSLQRRALLTFYLRPASIILKLGEIRSVREFLFKARLAFRMLIEIFRRR